MSTPAPVATRSPHSHRCSHQGETATPRCVVFSPPSVADATAAAGSERTRHRRVAPRRGRGVVVWRWGHERCDGVCGCMMTTRHDHAATTPDTPSPPTQHSVVSDTEPIGTGPELLLLLPPHCAAEKKKTHNTETKGGGGGGGGGS